MTMRTRNFFSFLLMAAVAGLVASCSKTENSTVEYIPFQETDDGQWGMISMDGKVLFKEEFKNKPTVVRDGRFFVRTNSGFWEMYEASEKPKKIGADYAHVSGFYNGRALVAAKNQPVSIIDTEGKEIKKLDKIDGKEVDGVRAFCEGYAVFMTTDSLLGAIDTDGKCVVKPEYCSLKNCGDNKFIGVHKKYKKNIDAGKKDKVKVSVVNTSGKVLFDFRKDKYESFHARFVDGKLAVCVKKDGNKTWGIIDDRGEYVVKPSAKLKEIGDMSGDLYTYNNGEGWGLMNVEGETLIRAKYEYLYIDEDNLLVAIVKDGDSYEYKYVDQKDNQVGEDTYVTVFPFCMFDDEHTLVKPNDKIFSIIDRNGKQLEGLPDIVDIGIEDGESYIKSDYVDLDKLVAAFNITQDGMMGITFNSKPQDAVKIEVKEGAAAGTDEHKAGLPYWYDYSSAISIDKTVNGVSGHANISFTGNLSRQTFRKKMVVDYTYGDWYWYHYDHIPTGYVWNDVKPRVFNLIFGNEGRMHGKMRALYKVLYAKFKKMGKVEKENNGAAVISLKNGKRAIVGLKKDNVFVQWGDLKPAKDIDISEYEDACEEDDYDYSEDTGTYEVDTTAVYADTTSVL